MSMVTHARHYGYLPDLADQRDHAYAVPAHLVGVLPPMVDLRPHCPSVLDQGQLGSCTANALANAHAFAQRKFSEGQFFVPSRLFIYYNERVLEGTTRSDAGAMLRDGMKTLARQGVCSEHTWPYLIGRFTNRPPASCYTEAMRHQALVYQRLTPTLPQLQGCLASGYPFVFGFTVYESFESEAVAVSGVVAMPELSEQVVGGHAVLAVGYDNATQRFLVMNSWGTAWGTHGCFTMPYAYLTSSALAQDFWTVRLVEAP